jgi:hypothetical protein
MVGQRGYKGPRESMQACGRIQLNRAPVSERLVGHPLVYLRHRKSLWKFV